MLKPALLHSLDTLKNLGGPQLKSTKLGVPVSFLNVYMKAKNYDVPINGTNITVK